MQLHQLQNYSVFSPGPATSRSGTVIADSLCLSVCLCVCLQLQLSSQTRGTPCIIDQNDHLSPTIMDIQKEIRSAILDFGKKGQKTSFLSCFSAHRPPRGLVVLMKSDGLITYWAWNFNVTPSFALFQIQNGSQTRWTPCIIHQNDRLSPTC